VHNGTTSRIQFFNSDKPVLSELRFGFYLGDAAGHDVVSPLVHSYFGPNNMQTLLQK